MLYYCYINVILLLDQRFSKIRTFNSQEGKRDASKIPIKKYKEGITLRKY